MQVEFEDVLEERHNRNAEQEFQHKDRVMRIAAKRKKFFDSRKPVDDVDSKEFLANAKKRSYRHSYRPFMIEQDTNFKGQDIVDIYKEQEGCCYSCFQDLRYIGYEIDHKRAVESAGNNSKANIQLLCFTCNRSKHNKDYSKWISEVRAEQVREYLYELSEEDF